MVENEIKLKGDLSYHDGLFFSAFKALLDYSFDLDMHACFFENLF